jgi:hypothetical protein
MTSNAGFRLIVSDVPLTSGMYNATITNGEVEDYYLLTILAAPGNILTGRKLSNGNLLKWKNISGLPITSFTIERSGDNLSWSALGFVTPLNGNSFSTEYSYSDVNPNKENYYRLKFSLSDGTYQYSNIVPLFDNNDAVPVIIYPNPATKTLKVQTANSNYNKLKILDVAGRVVLTQEINSLNTIIDITKLAAGTHIIKFITKDGQEEIQRFVKIK